jgi:hypothetical protein
MIQDGNWGVLSRDEERRLTLEELAEYVGYRRWLSDHRPRWIGLERIPRGWMVYNGETWDVLRDDSMRDWRLKEEDDGVLAVPEVAEGKEER